jgi:hypothetical protein
MALLFLAIGLAVVLLALVRTSPPGKPPVWVAACAGGLFILASLLMALQGRRDSLLAQAVFAAVLTDFAALFDWVGLGPGPRQFSGGVSFLGLTSSGPWSPASGRIVFATMGIAVSVLALLVWVSAAKALWRRFTEAGRTSTEGPPPAA